MSAKMDVIASLGKQLRALRDATGDSPDAAEAFLIIARSPGLSVGELAEELDVPQATASRFVKNLRGSKARRGEISTSGGLLIKWDIGEDRLPLITQEVDSENPRRTALSVSEDGAALIDQLVKVDA